MDLLEVGKIINTHGLRGEVKIVPWTDAPEVFEDIDAVYVKRGDDYERLTVRSVRYQKNNLIIKFAEINDIDAAARYKNRVISAERETLGVLPEGVYYIADLIGLNAVKEDGTSVGKISDVFNAGAGDIYVIKRDGMKDMLLPTAGGTVLNIDLEGKTAVVRIPDGLEDL